MVSPPRGPDSESLSTPEQQRPLSNHTELETWVKCVITHENQRHGE